MTYCEQIFNEIEPERVGRPYLWMGEDCDAHVKAFYEQMVDEIWPQWNVTFQQRLHDFVNSRHTAVSLAQLSNTRPKPSWTQGLLQAGIAGLYRR